MKRVSILTVLVVILMSLIIQPTYADNPPQINYPPGISNQQKLREVYSLIEQMRLEHNRVGVIARSDWPANAMHWYAYTRIFSDTMLPLLKEQNRLTEAINESLLISNPVGKRPIGTGKTINKNRSNEKSISTNKAVAKSILPTATYTGLTKLMNLNFSKLTASSVDPVENFTTYTKVDPLGYISITPTRVTATNITDNASSYVYKDYGPGFFHDYTHLFTTGLSLLDDITGNGSILYVNGTINGTYSDLSVPDGMVVTAYDDTGTTQIQFSNYDFSKQDIAAEPAMTIPGVYYLKVTRVDTTATLYIYADSNRTLLIDTLTYICTNNPWSIIETAVTDFPPTSPQVSTFYVENLDLQLPQPPTPTPPTPAQQTDIFFKTMVKLAIAAAIIFFLIKHETKDLEADLPRRISNPF